MAEIIDEQPFKIEFTCKGCGSRLAAKAHDIKTDWINERYTYYAACPVCGEQRTFERTELPKGVIRQADLKG